MGPVNWLAVMVATLIATGLVALWFRRGPMQPAALAGSGALLFVSAAMIGHMFARVGADTLTVKPWLYFMMSGGLAGAFIIPAMGVNYLHMPVGLRRALTDAAFWLIAYLAMGLVFFAMARFTI